MKSDVSFVETIFDSDNTINVCFIVHHTALILVSFTLCVCKDGGNFSIDIVIRSKWVLK